MNEISQRNSELGFYKFVARERLSKNEARSTRLSSTCLVGLIDIP